MARAAGLTNLKLERKSGYIDSMTSLNDPLFRRILDALPEGTQVGEYVTSLYVQASKPATCCCGG
jgi:spore maturation protein SpmA